MSESSPRELERALAGLAGEILAHGEHPPLEGLVAYAEGRLGPSEAEVLQDHLAACPECADTLLDLRAFEREVEAEEGSPQDDPRQSGERQGRLLSFPFPRPAGPLLSAVAAVMVLAVGLLLWRPGGEPLPVYTAELTGGAAATRHASAGVFPPGSRLELVLRPMDEVTGDLAVAVYRRRGDGAVALDVPVEISPRGVAVLGGVVGHELDLPAGDQRLLVAIGREGELPAGEELVARLAGSDRASGEGWTAWRFDVAVDAEEENEE